MAEQKHTPGPWEFRRIKDHLDATQERNVVRRVWQDSGNRTHVQFIAEIFVTVGHEDEVVPTGLTLAAAPELLEALELMVDNEPLTAIPADQRRAITDKAEAAIRKAKGD